MKNFDLSKLTPKARALELLFANWNPQPVSEAVPLEQTRGRVLAEDALARYTIPLVRAASMDSVAVRSADFAGGAPDTTGWKRGEQYTLADMGDDFDDRFDAAIPVESAELLPDGGIRLKNVDSVRPGDGINAAGTTAREGEPLLCRGTRIGPVEMGVLASGGITQVRCWKKPVVALIPTGSELVARGEIPQRGQNIESNSLMLRQMVLDMGAEPLCFPIVKDIPGQMESVLNRALDQADLIVVNAGSSKGEEDFSTRMLKKLGTFLFHEVAAVPGRPLSIAIERGKPVINIPGPPLAAYNGADWCLREAVARFLQTVPDEHVAVQAVLTGTVESTPLLRYTARVRVYRQDGTIYAEPIPRDACSMAKTMAANGIYISEAGVGTADAGTMVTVHLTRGIEQR